MTKPLVLRIGPFDYEVRWVDRPEATVERRFGWCDNNDQVICVQLGLKCQKTADTLLHEIAHALVWNYGGAIDESDHIKEEDFVGWIANGLIQVWRDNPDLLPWFQEILARPREAFKE